MTDYSAIQQVRRDLTLRYAEGSALTVLGQSRGVPRPLLLTDDEIYRRCVQVLAWQPKLILFTTYALMNAIFGTQSEIIARGSRAWQVYQVSPNEIVIELPTDLIGTSNENASYFHGWDGYAYNATGGYSATFTTEGEVQKCSATALSGGTVPILIYDRSTGLWDSGSTITNYTYNALTNISTITLDSAAVRPGGDVFHIQPAGDDIMSFRGDYVAPGQVLTSFYTLAGSGTTNYIRVNGDYSGELSNGMSVSLIYDGAIHIHTISTSPGYVDSSSSPGEYTDFQVTPATVPLGLTSGLLLRTMEKADTGATAPHADRVYLTGNGLYEIFEFYYIKLVKAAGVLLRLERV